MTPPTPAEDAGSPTPERVTKVKDPKRVAAGKASAKARKNKLEELQRLKSLHAPPVTGLPQVEAPVERAKPAPVGTTAEPVAAPHQSSAAPAPWLLIGGIAVVLGFIVWNGRGSNVPAAPELDSRDAVNIKAPSASRIRDPHYMA